MTGLMTIIKNVRSFKKRVKKTKFNLNLTEKAKKYLKHPISIKNLKNIKETVHAFFIHLSQNLYPKVLLKKNIIPIIKLTLNFLMKKRTI